VSLIYQRCGYSSERLGSGALQEILVFQGLVIIDVRIHILAIVLENAVLLLSLVSDSDVIEFNRTKCTRMIFNLYAYPSILYFDLKRACMLISLIALI